MTVEQQVSPNIYPSAESVKVEPIAILTSRKGVRRVLFKTQALILQVVLKFLDETFLDKTTFSSEGLYEDIWPGLPYQSGAITQSMNRLRPHIAEVGGAIITRPSETDRHLNYEVYLPEDARAKIKIKMRKIPTGVTFHQPYGNISTGEEAFILHELIKDHLTAESAIPVNELWKLALGDMPYSVSGMSHLLRSTQQDLEGTGMLVEKLANYRKTDEGNIVHAHSSVFLNLSGYIEKLKAETTEVQLPVFTDEDVLAFVELLSVFGSERILKAHHVNLTPAFPSLIFGTRAEITKRFEYQRKRLPDPKVCIPALVEKLLKLSEVERKKIKGSLDAQRIFAIFEELDEQQMRACLAELYGVYTTYKH